VDILINNAGTMLAKTVMSEDSVEILKREMDVNVLGMLAMCKAFAPVLARNGGGVIFGAQDFPASSGQEDHRGDSWRARLASSCEPN
jgi:NADP-dependent 3-hydroxy acid dehydrogenase YdfG